MAKSKRTLKKIPTFNNEDQERQFWAKADSTEYVDWSKARIVRFPNLRPSADRIAAEHRRAGR